MKLVSFGRPILDVTMVLQPFKSYISIGGVETNVAINTALLGENAIFLGAVGLDILCKKLESLVERVNKLCLGLQKIKNRKSGMIVMLIEKNDEVYQKFVDYGASECFRITSTIREQIEKGELFFTSLFNANTFGLGRKWQEMIRLAKSNSLKIAVSLAGIATIEANALSPLLEFLKCYADFVFMNHQEAEKIDPTIFTSQLVVITDEDRSAIAKFENKEFSVPPERKIKVHRPYTIGAGDAFTAAFLVNYFRTGDIEEAMRYGHQIAALKLSIPTSHLTPEILEKEVKL
jgi:sugar/nucleoside kinase (ribokinase family)